jgi:hypothetical protein
MSQSCFPHFKELTYSAKIKIFARLMGKFSEGVQYKASVPQHGLKASDMLKINVVLR